MDEEALTINEQLAIPLSELGYRFSRSSGPGGQHVQKTATRVELLFDVANSPSLTDVQRAKILERLQRYIDTSGLLHLVAQSERSQLRNREEVTARFQSLMQQALKTRRRRKATRPSAASRERRIRKKRHRSQIKKWRTPVHDDE
jgi:ribosome-associated protein